MKRKANYSKGIIFSHGFEARHWELTVNVCLIFQMLVIILTRYIKYNILESSFKYFYQICLHGNEKKKNFGLLSVGSWLHRLERRKLCLQIALSSKHHKRFLAQHNYSWLCFNCLDFNKSGTEHSVRDCYSNWEQRGAWTDEPCNFCSLWSESPTGTSRWIECFECGLKFFWAGMGSSLRLAT